jgi:hypothetical protein
LVWKMRCFPLAITSTSQTRISSRCAERMAPLLPPLAPREGIIEAAMQDSRNPPDPDTGTAHEGEDS